MAIGCSIPQFFAGKIITFSADGNKEYNATHIMFLVKILAVIAIVAFLVSWMIPKDEENKKIE